MKNFSNICLKLKRLAQELKLPKGSIEDNLDNVIPPHPSYENKTQLLSADEWAAVRSFVEEYTPSLLGFDFKQANHRIQDLGFLIKGITNPLYGAPQFALTLEKRYFEKRILGFKEGSIQNIPEYMYDDYKEDINKLRTKYENVGRKKSLFNQIYSELKAIYSTGPNGIQNIIDDSAKRYKALWEALEHKEDPNHPQTQKLLKQFKDTTIAECEDYKSNSVTDSRLQDLNDLSLKDKKTTLLKYFVFKQPVLEEVREVLKDILPDPLVDGEEQYKQAEIKLHNEIRSVIQPLLPELKKLGRDTTGWKLYINQNIGDAIIDLIRKKGLIARRVHNKQVFSELANVVRLPFEERNDPTEYRPSAGKCPICGGISVMGFRHNGAPVSCTQRHYWDGTCGHPECANTVKVEAALPNNVRPLPAAFRIDDLGFHFENGLTKGEWARQLIQKFKKETGIVTVSGQDSPSSIDLIELVEKFSNENKIDPVDFLSLVMEYL